MRRLDWFFAGVVTAFLAAAVIVEANVWQQESVALGRMLPSGAGEVTVRRLVSQWPRAPLLPGDPR